MECSESFKRDKFQNNLLNFKLHKNLQRAHNYKLKKSCNKIKLLIIN